ncbi:MAG: excisionase [Acidovorax sp.]
MTAEVTSQAFVQSARFVTIKLCAAMTGLSPAAIEKRIERGHWVENKEWRRGRDGRIWIDTKGIEAWVLQATG